MQLYISGPFATCQIQLRPNLQRRRKAFKVHMQIILNVHIVFSNILLVIALITLAVSVILPGCQCSEGQKVSRGMDLPIVMQTMFIIQLQIVPDKVLLGNRDTFTESQREGRRENNQS